jgi:hypothetical protein
MGEEVKTRKMDLKEAQMCALCEKTTLKDVVFYTVKIGQAVVNHRALQQFGGLMMKFGGGPETAALADVFTPERTIAEVLPEKEVHICHDCFLGGDGLVLARLWSE